MYHPEKIIQRGLIVLPRAVVYSTGREINEIFVWVSTSVYLFMQYNVITASRDGSRYHQHKKIRRASIFWFILGQLPPTIHFLV